MRVRLAFAVAAHLEPEILLIDEVLAVGDDQFQKKCMQKMHDVQQQGRTIIFVSHSMPAINRLCSRTILLNDGKIVVDGPTHEVVKSYLSQGEITQAEREWPVLSDAPGDDVVRLVAVRARTENGTISGSADIRKPIKLQMEYIVLKPGFGFMIYFHVVDENGIEAFTTIENDPAWRGRQRPVGHYVSSAEIPGNFLSEGAYFVGAALRTWNPMVRRFSSHDHIAFHVVDSLEGDSARVDFTGNMSGVVRPMLKWDTLFDPQKNTIA
jgi:lipopolysaccharide transport system ATP-binding protein